MFIVVSRYDNTIIFNNIINHNSNFLIFFADYEDFSDDVKTGGSFRHQLSVAELLAVGEVDLCKPASTNDESPRIEVEVV